MFEDCFIYIYFVGWFGCIDLFAYLICFVCFAYAFDLLLCLILGLACSLHFLFWGFSLLVGCGSLVIVVWLEFGF